MSSENYNTENALMCRIIINTVRAAAGMDPLPENRKMRLIGWYENGRLRTKKKKRKERYRFYGKYTGEFLAEGTAKEIAEILQIDEESVHRFAILWKVSPDRAKRYRVEYLSCE